MYFNRAVCLFLSLALMTLAACQPSPSTPPAPVGGTTPSITSGNAHAERLHTMGADEVEHKTIVAYTGSDTTARFAFEGGRAYQFPIIGHPSGNLIPGAQWLALSGDQNFLVTTLKKSGSCCQTTPVFQFNFPVPENASNVKCRLEYAHETIHDSVSGYLAVEEAVYRDIHERTYTGGEDPFTDPRHATVWRGFFGYSGEVVDEHLQHGQLKSVEFALSPDEPFFYISVHGAAAYPGFPAYDHETLIAKAVVTFDVPKELISPSPEESPSPQSPEPSSEPSQQPSPQPERKRKPQEPFAIVADSAFSPRGHHSGPNDPHKQNVVKVAAKGAWTVSVNNAVIQRGADSRTFFWDGTVNGVPLAEGRYSLWLRSLTNGKSRKADVIIDNSQPKVSNLRMIQEPSDPTGNSFTFQGIVDDVGIAGLELEKLKVEIKGGTITGTENPFSPKSWYFSKKFTIVPVPGQIITADVTAVDKAGNVVTMGSGSDDAQRFAQFVDRIDLAQSKLIERMAATCSARANVYSVLAAKEKFVDYTAMRDAEAAAAWLVASDDHVSKEARIAAFVYWADLNTFVITSSDDVLQAIVGYKLGKVAVGGTILVFKSAAKSYPQLEKALCNLIKGEDGSFYGFQLPGARGTLFFEKNIVKPLSNHERTVIAELLDNGLNVTVKKHSTSGGVTFTELLVNGTRFAIEENADITVAERNLILYLLRKGHPEPVVVHVPAGSKGISGQRTSDFQVSNRRAELKSIGNDIKGTSENDVSSTVASRVMDARGQADYVIIDGRENLHVTEAAALRGIKRAFGADGKTGAQQGTGPKIHLIRVIGVKGTKPDGSLDIFDISVPRI